MENPFLQRQENVDPLGSSFDSSTKATLPFDKTVIPSYTLVVDSRQRNCKKYPNPSNYTVYLGDVYKNITSIELRGAAIPKSSYNVHSTNCYIDFAIGDSVTKIQIEDQGEGYDFVPDIDIIQPISGIPAIAEAIVDPVIGVVTSIVIVHPGSGYSPGNPPSIIIQSPNRGRKARAKVIIGTHYTAKLRHGQYTIGGNPPGVPGGRPSGLINEIQNAINFAVNGPPYDPNSINPFEVRLVSQYPTLDADPGSPEAFPTNSAQFNRIQITNVDSEYWELLFCSGPNSQRSAVTLMGFIRKDIKNPISTPAVVTSSGQLIASGTTLRADYDYNLLDDPTFILLTFQNGTDTFERIRSYDPSLNRKFGVMIFDANTTDVVKDTTGLAEEDLATGIPYLEGPVTKGTFWAPPGTLKALKGFDFDQKKIEFQPPIGKFTNLNIQFTKYGTQFGGRPELYDFQGRDHILIFDLKAGNLSSGGTQ